MWSSLTFCFLVWLICLHLPLLLPFQSCLVLKTSSRPILLPASALVRGLCPEVLLHRMGMREEIKRIGWIHITLKFLYNHTNEELRECAKRKQRMNIVNFCQTQSSIPVHFQWSKINLTVLPVEKNWQLSGMTHSSKICNNDWSQAEHYHFSRWEQ